MLLLISLHLFYYMTTSLSLQLQLILFFYLGCGYYGNLSLNENRGAKPYFWGASELRGKNFRVHVPSSANWKSSLTTSRLWRRRRKWQIINNRAILCRWSDAKYWLTKNRTITTLSSSIVQPPFPSHPSRACVHVCMCACVPKVIMYNCAPVLMTSKWNE